MNNITLEEFLPLIPAIGAGNVSLSAPAESQIASSFAYTLKEYSCAYCAMVFANSTSRYRHQKSCTSQIKDGVCNCDKCGDTFKRKDNLLRHKCREANSCKLCQQSFSRHDAFKRHQCPASSVGSAAFSCHLCDYATPRKDNLARHMKLKHPQYEVSLSSKSKRVDQILEEEGFDVQAVKELKFEEVLPPEVLFSIAASQEPSAIINQEEIEYGGSSQHRNLILPTDRPMNGNLSINSLPSAKLGEIAPISQSLDLGPNSAHVSHLESARQVSPNQSNECHQKADPVVPPDTEIAPNLGIGAFIQPLPLPLPAPGKQSCLKLPSQTVTEFQQISFTTSDGKVTGKKTLPLKRAAARRTTTDGDGVDILEKEVNQSQAAQSYSSAFLQTAADTNCGPLTSIVGVSSVDAFQSSSGRGLYAQTRDSGPQTKRKRIREVSSFCVTEEEGKKEDEEEEGKEVSPLPLSGIPIVPKRPLSFIWALKNKNLEGILEIVPETNAEDYEGKFLIEQAHVDFGKLMTTTATVQEPLKYKRRKLDILVSSSSSRGNQTTADFSLDLFSIMNQRIVSTLENSACGSMTQFPRSENYREWLMTFPENKRAKVYACTQAGEQAWINSAAPDELFKKDSRIFKRPPLRRVFSRLGKVQKNDIGQMSQFELERQLSSTYYQCRRTLNCTLAWIQNAIDDIIDDPKSYSASLDRLHSEQHRCFGKTLLARLSEGAAATRHCNELCYLTDEAFGHISHLEQNYYEVERMRETCLQDSRRVALISLKAPNYRSYLGPPAQMQMRADKCSAQCTKYNQHMEQSELFYEEIKELISQANRYTPPPPLNRKLIKLPKIRMTYDDRLEESTDEEEVGTDDEELQEMFNAHGFDIEMKRYRKRLETIVRVLKRKSNNTCDKFTQEKNEFRYRWASSILTDIRNRWHIRMDIQEEMQNIHIARVAEHFQDFKTMLLMNKEEQKIQADLEKQEKSKEVPKLIALPHKVLKIDYEWARDIICKNRSLLSYISLFKKSRRSLFSQTNMESFKDSQLIIDVFLCRWQNSLKVARRAALQHFVMLNIDTSLRNPSQRQYYKVDLKSYFFEDIVSKYKLTERDFKVTIQVAQEWRYKNIASMNNSYHSYVALNSQIRHSVKLLFKLLNSLQIITAADSSSDKFDRLACAQCIMKQLGSGMLALDEVIIDRSTAACLKRQLTSQYQRMIRVNAHQTRLKELKLLVESDVESSKEGTLFKSVGLPSNDHFQSQDPLSQCKEQYGVLREHINRLVMLCNNEIYSLEIDHRSTFVAAQNEDDSSADLHTKIKIWKTLGMQAFLKKRKVFRLKVTLQARSSLAEGDLTDINTSPSFSSSTVIEIVDSVLEEDIAMQQLFRQYSQQARESQRLQKQDHAYDSSNSSSDSDKDSSKHHKDRDGDLIPQENADETKRNDMKEIDPAIPEGILKDTEMEKSYVLNVRQSKKVQPNVVAELFGDRSATAFGKKSSSKKPPGCHAIKCNSLLQGSPQISAVGDLNCQLPIATNYIANTFDAVMHNDSNIDRVPEMENDQILQTQVSPKQVPSLDYSLSYRPFGLPHLGNSQSMNAVLQCLFTLTRLRQLVSRAAITAPDLALIPLTNSIEEVRSTEKSRTNAELAEHLQNILTIIDKVQTQFTTVTEKQNDAYEFFKALLFKLNVEMCNVSEPNQATTIPELFSSQLQVTTTCTVCGRSATTTNSIQDLSLSMPPSNAANLWTIRTAFRLFFASKRLRVESQCAQCGHVGLCSQQYRLVSSPEIMVIQLKKFQSAEKDDVPDNSQHMQNGIDIPMFLDLSSFMVQDRRNVTHMFNDNKSMQNVAKYELCAVVHQREDTNSDCRFYCDVLHASGNVKNKESWYICNDTLIAQHSARHNYIGCKTACMLFYRRIMT